jgi:hypothetical protein
MVAELPHHPEVEGLNLASAVEVSEKMAEKTFLLIG